MQRISGSESLLVGDLVVKSVNDVYNSAILINKSGKISSSYDKVHLVPFGEYLPFKKCFMGRSLAIAQITDKPKYREGLPLTLNVDYVPFYDYKDPKNSTKKSIIKIISFYFF